MAAVPGPHPGAFTTSGSLGSQQSAPQVAAVVGSSGGLGAAFVAHLALRPEFTRVLALSRRPVADQVSHVVAAAVDITDEASIAAAAAKARALGELRLVIVATGLLHGEGLSPEKTWSALTWDALVHAFAVNSIGPALVAKHFLPLLPRHGRSVFAALSARVGSIEDNRLGGWYAYRASKAALNMLLKTFAVELARRAPEAVCVGLHPGTVDTRLSKPFQGNVAPDSLRQPAEAAARLLEVIRRLRPEDSGGVFAWDGARLPA
jgi:NAD(P)-dependent dehydrogenase (short-subunit alcohol dehydrogenase family)